jgi:hypothetical protein
MGDQFNNLFNKQHFSNLFLIVQVPNYSQKLKSRSDLSEEIKHNILLHHLFLVSLKIKVWV